MLGVSLLACSACLQAQPDDNPKFRPDEEMAIGQVCGLSIMEALICKQPMKRWCTMEELVKGDPGANRRGIGRDPNAGATKYRYVIAVSSADIAISAIPRKSGLGGFLNDTTGVYFNADGPATRADKKIRGGADCDFLRKK